MTLTEKEFENKIMMNLESKHFIELISNYEEMKLLAKAHLEESLISNIHGALDHLYVLNWSEGILLLDEMKIIKNQVKLIKGRGKSSFADIIFQLGKRGTFSIVELKRPISRKSSKKSTIRESISEILGYNNALCSLFPGLSDKNNLLIIISSDWPKIIVNAIQLLSSFHGLSIVPVSIEYEDGDNFNLKIIKPQTTWTIEESGISPKIFTSAKIHFSTDDIHPQLLIKIIKNKLNNYGLHGFLLITEDKNSDNITLSVFCMNPYLLMKEKFDTSNLDIIKPLLELPENANLDEIINKVEESARKWDNNISSVIEQTENFLQKFNINIEALIEHHDFDLFLKERRFNEISIWIEFFGFLSNFYHHWIMNKNNQILISQLGYKVDKGKDFALIYGHIGIRTLALADIIQISDFNSRLLNPFEVFLHGRSWGRITTLALMGTEEEYSSELPYFFISFAKSPFKIPIKMNKEDLGKNGDTYVELMSSNLSKNGSPILGYLFLLSYSIESLYVFNQLKKPKEHLISNLELFMKNFKEYLEKSECYKLYEKLQLFEEFVKNKNHSPELISKKIIDFQNFLKQSQELDFLTWDYHYNGIKWDSGLKHKIKVLMEEYKDVFQYPVVVILPNGDFGISDLDQTSNPSKLIDYWQNIDINTHFIAIDFGEDIGVTRLVPFNKGSDPGVIIHRKGSDQFVHEL